MAEVGREKQRRVVLQMRSGRSSPVALEAAIRMARALESELEGVFVEDEHLLSLAALPFAREISSTGRRSRPLSADVVGAEMRAAAATLRREFERLARAAAVPARFAVVRDEPERALRIASARASVLALCDPSTGEGLGGLRAVTACLSDLMGCLLVGAAVRRTSGRVIVALDALAVLPELVRMAERLAAATREELVLVKLGETLAAGGEADRLIGRALTGRIAVTVAQMGSDDAMPETARRLGGGLLVAGFGGAVAPGEAELARLTAQLECPLLLLRSAPERVQPGAEAFEAPPGGATSSRT